MELSKSSRALANSDKPLHTLFWGCLRESFEAYKLLSAKITHVTLLLAEFLQSTRLTLTEATLSRGMRKKGKNLESRHEPTRKRKS